MMLKLMYDPQINELLINKMIGLKSNKIKIIIEKYFINLRVNSKEIEPIGLS